MSPRKSKPDAWLAALEAQDLEVRSARDGLQSKGWLDTGNHALNWAISGRVCGGYPLGHTIEIFGDPGTGKSFLVTRAVAMMQSIGGVALLDDTEGAWNLEHTQDLGVNVDTLAYRRSRTVKEHLDTTLAFIKVYQSGKITVPGLIAVDSLAQLSTEHERAVALDKKDMTKAGELKAFFRIVSGDLLDYPVVHISTNHVIANVGSVFQARTTSGGGGPKYQASVRLDLRATSKIKDSIGEKVGVICRVVVDKNRIVAPWKEVRLAIPFNQTISPASGLVPLLVKLGIVEARGNFLWHEGQKLGRFYKGKDKFLQQDEVGEELLDQFPELLEETDRRLAQGTVQPLHQGEAEDVVEAVDE